MDKQRARSARDKAQRCTVILKEARRALADRRVGEITIAGIARAAGLGNATLYTYFEGKEDILLSVFEQELEAMIQEMCDRLPGTGDPGSAAQVLVHAVISRLVYRRLAVVVHTQLEPRVSEPRRVAFRAQLLTALERAGSALEKSLPALPPGGGAAALRRLHGLALGLHQLVDDDGTMIGSDVDFAREMHDALTFLLLGMTRPESPHA